MSKHLKYTIPAILLMACGANALTPSDNQKPVKMRPASELISEQAPGKINPAVLERASREPIRIVISLTKQRAYLFVGSQVAVDSPISSGRRNGWTPKGEFSVLEKDPNHFSSLYGDFIDDSGRTVR